MYHTQKVALSSSDPSYIFIQTQKSHNEVSEERSELNIEKDQH